MQFRSLCSQNWCCILSVEMRFSLCAFLRLLWALDQAKKNIIFSLLEHHEKMVRLWTNDNSREEILNLLSVKSKDFVSTECKNGRPESLSCSFLCACAL